MCDLKNEKNLFGTRNSMFHEFFINGQLDATTTHTSYISGFLQKIRLGRRPEDF